MSKEWRCFHCDELFTDRTLAAQHFGADENEEPACKLSEDRLALVELLRDAQAEVRSFRNESDASSRAFYDLGAKHHAELQLEEIKGYERGLKDGRAEDQHRDRWRTLLLDIHNVLHSEDGPKEQWEEISSIMQGWDSN